MKHSHRTQRFFAAMLVLVMMFTMLPAGVIAAENRTIQGAVETIKIGANVAYTR